MARDESEDVPSLPSADRSGSRNGNGGATVQIGPERPQSLSLYDADGFLKNSPERQRILAQLGLV